MTLIRPPSLRLEASSFCQLRCPSCPTTTRAIHPAIGSGFLKFADFKKLLDENPHVRDIELSNYGEIFLNPELLEIMKYAFESGVTLNAGNGVNLNHIKPEVLEGLVKYQFRSMTCSIDGASQESYSVYRVKGNYDRVIENIREINFFKKKYASTYPTMSWQFIVFGHNEREIPAARMLAEELGMEFHLKLTWDDEFSPIRDREFVKEQLGEDTITREEYKKKYAHDHMERICHQLWDRPQINYDGKLLGCCRNFWGDFGGNAFQDGLVETINNEKMRYARKMLLGKAPERNDLPCVTCEIYLTMRETGNYLQRGGRWKIRKTFLKFYKSFGNKFNLPRSTRRSQRQEK